MSERDHPTSSESLEPEEQQTVPPFPFPLHIPREGETPLEPRLSFFDPASLTPAMLDVRQTWAHWVLDQPDSGLFALENGLFDMWFITKGQIPKAYWETYEREKERYLHEVRERGYGELIEKYWSHLLSSKPPPE